MLNNVTCFDSIGKSHLSVRSLLFVFSIVLFTSSFLFPQENESTETSYPKFIPYVVDKAEAEQNTSGQNISKVDIKSLWEQQPSRWLSVDPKADKYPGWSPYHYSLNNPLRYFDPNGQWSAERDKDGNIIAKYEKGDTYENLYKQLGMNTEQFASWTAKQNIELSLDPAGSSFNLTSFVVSNNNYAPNSTGSNCFGFVDYAIGKSPSENQVEGVNFYSSIGNPSSTASPHTGDIAVWSYTGNISGNHAEGLAPINGTPAHAAIFILNNQAGEAQFLNRTTLGASVSVNTTSDINSIYNSKITEAKQYGLNLPGISSPIYYIVK